jgi:hypothetical protein
MGGALQYAGRSAIRQPALLLAEAMSDPTGGLSVAGRLSMDMVPKPFAQRLLFTL